MEKMLQIVARYKPAQVKVARYVYLFIYLASPIIIQTNNMYTTTSVQPQSANVEKLMSSFVA